MSTLATRAAPVFRASASERPFLKRQRGVAAVAPAAFGEKLVHRAVATETETSAPKRACGGFDVKIIREEVFADGKESVVPASAPERLKQRMEAERDALGRLLKKAALLTRGTGRSSVAPTGKVDARIVSTKRQLEAPSADTAAKMRKSTPSKPASETKQSTEPKKQQHAVQRAAPRSTNGSMASRIDQARDVMKRRRLEEIAGAREKFRQELFEMEKAAMPDETIYPEELEELGIAAFQYDVTRTRKQVSLGSG